MDKIFYLSSTDLAQVDMGFLHHLAGIYEIYYNVIITEKSGNYTEDELFEYAKNSNIIFKAYRFQRRRRDLRIGLEYLKVLADIKKIKPDIIYTISTDIPVISLLNILLNKKKTIVSIHDVEYHSNIPYAFLFKIGRSIIMRHFSNFQLFSKNQENIFRKQYPQKTVFTIPLSLSDFGSKADTEMQVSDKKKVRFLFFGYIAPYKGLDGLLKTVNKLSKKYSNFELVIAGRCDVWDEVYEPLIENQSVIHKRIGFISNYELPGLFLNSHYLVLPYKDATQSGPLMIAYNYNIPVIASNIEAFSSEVSEGISGFLFNQHDAKSLEDVLESAILQTEEEYRHLKNRMKEFVLTNYSTEHIVEKYKEMFAEVIANNR